MAELKPCPFCGGKAIRHFLVSRYGSGNTAQRIYEIRDFGSGKGHIECQRCHIKQANDYSTMTSAERAWNRRANDASPGEKTAEQRGCETDGQG